MTNMHVPNRHVAASEENQALWQTTGFDNWYCTDQDVEGIKCILVTRLLIIDIVIIVIIFLDEFHQIIRYCIAIKFPKQDLLPHV